jgi:hypothetical protein
MKLVGVLGVQSRKFERQALLRVLQDPMTYGRKKVRVAVKWDKLG